MSIQSKLKALFEIPKCFLEQPTSSLKYLSRLPAVRRGSDFVKRFEGVTEGPTATARPEREPAANSSNPLWDFFDSRETGRGIWKWEHYFDMYQRHFGKFVGTEVNILEVGVYSGGSLEMWRNYFGSKCHVYGVDIEESCKVYENEYTSIIIGDQEDRSFWKSLKARVPSIDIVIDDGGHQFEQQIVTLEEMLPHLRPGGVYVCEDVYEEHSTFSAYVKGLVNNLNVGKSSAGGAVRVDTTEFQAWIHSAHFYPFVAVIEKATNPVRRFDCTRHGTEWQPFG